MAAAHRSETYGFLFFDLSALACASEAHDKRDTIRRASLPKAPVSSADSWDDDTTPVRAPAFSPYASGWEPTPPLTPIPSSGTAVTPVQSVVEPSRPAGTQPWLTPASEQNQVYAPLVIESETLGDFMIPPRLYQQRSEDTSIARFHIINNAD
ncbi:hypothetical protein FRC00_002024 [Tulasnella sp. 408]|nr:hypothetical protein FRC00_002024 [Tulasnella sp. 408]